ncbi:alpha-L-iduronidase [Haematobia irritans]|uniref:alpha-L-iduronidase n=1 Tax=Haematobia irritans TaxID=7368 RepID=UPI003F4F81A0
MSGSLAVLLSALSLSAIHNHGYEADNTTYYDFPKFWTNTGLCPPGDVTHTNIKSFLNSDSLQLNLLYLSALPKGTLTHIRIHWMLELLEFVQYSQSGLPVYNFDHLDNFLADLDILNLYPVIEFMGNISNIFEKNPSYNTVIWEELSYEVTKRYLNIFGAKKVLNWRLEMWNEPDLHIYNKLNFSISGYLGYAEALHRGIQRATIRPKNDLHISLRGPAGLFKEQTHHPLCWGILRQCNNNIKECPFEVLTFHKKGNGSAAIIIDESKFLVSKIFEMFPQLRKMPFSNDEADPTSGWSIPREFHEDVRYAIILVGIIARYWNAKLNNDIFSNMETISHDNAFLSFHPYEFSQRTLLAHFRMNNTTPPHSQFIQKPVYAALGILTRMGELASDLMEIKTSHGLKLNILKSTSAKGKPLYKSWLLFPVKEGGSYIHHSIRIPSFIHLCDKDIVVLIAEVIDQNKTNPTLVWRQFGSPAFPNSTVREEMRRRQTPQIHDLRVLETPDIYLNFSKLYYPWIMVVRMCSSIVSTPYEPKSLQVTAITSNEVFVTWQEASVSLCLKTYEVWFRSNNFMEWTHISRDWHIPFPSFHYAPGRNANGFYRVRSVDVFNRTSPFSRQVQYIEI